MRNGREAKKKKMRKSTRFSPAVWDMYNKSKIWIMCVCVGVWHDMMVKILASSVSKRHTQGINHLGEILNDNYLLVFLRECRNEQTNAKINKTTFSMFSIWLFFHQTDTHTFDTTDCQMFNNNTNTYIICGNNNKQIRFTNMNCSICRRTVRS